MVIHLSDCAHSACRGFCCVKDLDSKSLGISMDNVFSTIVWYSRLFRFFVLRVSLAADSAAFGGTCSNETTLRNCFEPVEGDTFNPVKGLVTAPGAIVEGDTFNSVKGLATEPDAIVEGDTFIPVKGLATEPDFACS